ncbi:MAG: SMC family ATPase, partial [Chloroflexia bacterium]
MIPIRLSLRNFMCYREQTETLDLTGVHLACLSGENGAGKSALLEAITWVLWGRARNREMNDELISKGATEMEVDFEFLLNGDSYRVIRKRSTKGKTGSTMLDIQVLDPGSANPRTLTGATIRESQERIISLLKLDYETFTNSAFIMQGRADQFTVKSPTERKKVLTEILGLEQYDRLEEEAKSRARDRAATVGMKKAEIERIDRDLLHRPDYVRRLEEVEDELTVKQAGLADIRGELTKIRTHEQRLEHTRDRLVEIANRIQHRERGMDVVKTRIVRNDEKRKSLESLVSRRADIESGWAGLQSLQERDDRLNGVRTDLDRLTIQSTKLDGTLSEERIRLDSLAQRHGDNIRRYQQNLAGRGVLDQQLSEVLSKLNKLALMQQQHEDTRCEKEAQEVRLRTLHSERDTLEKEGKSLRQKLD